MAFLLIYIGIGIIVAYGDMRYFQMLYREYNLYDVNDESIIYHILNIIAWPILLDECTYEGLAWDGDSN